MAADAGLSVLNAAAADGSIDVAQWPRVLEALLQRLHDIVYSEFPLPSAPLSLPPPAQPILRSQREPSVVPESSVISQQSETTVDRLDAASQTSSTGNKENTAPATNVLNNGSNAPQHQQHPQTQYSAQGQDPLAALPDLYQSYQGSISALKTSFADAPPYTLQRLAELVLHPKRHYRNLPPYLAALDRVVSVSSNTTAFPLSQPRTVPNGILHANGESRSSTDLGGDEGLGGALLTPIPWLRKPSSPESSSTTQYEDSFLTNGSGVDEELGRTVDTEGRTDDGPQTTTHVSNPLSHGPIHEAVESELRELGAVTQGELLRQEQEAGVVPVAQTTRRNAPLASGEIMDHSGAGIAGQSDGSRGSEDEKPHARGPEEIGMEDLGPQSGALGADRPLDMEAALGRKRGFGDNDQSGHEEHIAEASLGRAAEDEHKETPRDEDGDYVLVDASPQT